MSCVSNNNDGKDNQNDIISYKGAPNAHPTTTAAPVIDNCLDELAEKAIPIPAKPVNISDFDVRTVPSHLEYRRSSFLMEHRKHHSKRQLGESDIATTRAG
jgi:hypothetical protein